jgi:hypothetical protein
MKRTRSLASYFSPIAQQEQQQEAIHPLAVPSPPPPHPEEEQGSIQPPAVPSQSQGTEQESAVRRTRGSGVDVDLSQPTIEQDRTSLPAEETSNENANFVEEGDSNHVLGPEDIIADPALRKLIEEMHPNIRDDAKREYVLLGPCQPKGHAYPKRIIYGRSRSFHEKWFTNRPWLEYSVSKDAAFCFYCYLFKPLRVDNYGVESFTSNGFTNWKDGPKLFDAHGKSIAHNKARKDYECYKNQRQSVSHVISRGSQKAEEEYRGRLIIILGVVRFLLLQAHAFRGHDESFESNNKGNFLEMLDWYKEKDAKVARLLDSAGRNHTMTSHKVQKDLCKACAEETSKVIIAEIGDRYFAVLVDEARDASIKEQMAVVLRFVCFLLLISFLQFIANFLCILVC